jgi:hypothetical protein
MFDRLRQLHLLGAKGSQRDGMMRWLHFATKPYIRNGRFSFDRYRSVLVVCMWAMRAGVAPISR